MTIVTNEVEEMKASEDAEVIDVDDLKEIATFCPNCKSLQTLMFSRGKLVGQRRYHQSNGHVYHDCGSDKPCRFL
jgi:hypothetical protein